MGMHGQDGQKEGNETRERSCSGARRLGETTEDRDPGQISQGSDARIWISAFVGTRLMGISVVIVSRLYDYLRVF